MNTESTIEAMNLSIVEFMQLEKDRQPYLTDGRYRTTYLVNGYWLPLRKLKYHTSWDWIVPVVEKIEKLENGRFGFTIDPWGIDIIDYLGAFEGRGETVIINVNREPADSTMLNDYYDAVYQFITWYNQQKQNNDTTGTNKG